MEVNIEIGGRTEALDEGHGAGVGLGPFLSGLLDQERGDDPVNDLQHWREVLRMGGQQDAQRDRKRQHPLTHRHPRDDVVDPH